MTIVRHIPQQLILSHAPWGQGWLLIAFIVLASGAGLGLVFAGEPTGLYAMIIGAGLPLAIFALSIKRDQTIFDATTGTVTLQRRTLWRYSRCDYAIADVRRAELQEIAETARPALIIDDAALPLIEAYIAGNRPRQAVKAINDWLWDAKRQHRRA